MKRRTLDVIDAEITDLELQILDIKKSIHEDAPDWREPWRRKTGDIGPGYIPLAERREKIKLLQAKVDRLMKERKAINAKQSQTSGKKFGYGELKETVAELAKRADLKAGKTVPAKTVRKWNRDLKQKGYQSTEESLRVILSRLGFSKETPRKM